MISIVPAWVPDAPGMTNLARALGVGVPSQRPLKKAFVEILQQAVITRFIVCAPCTWNSINAGHSADYIPVHLLHAVP